MSLDELLGKIEQLRTDYGVSFAVDPQTGAIGTADSQFYSPLEVLSRLSAEPPDPDQATTAADADRLGLSADLAFQLTVVSDGESHCFLRSLVASACGLSP